MANRTASSYDGLGFAQQPDEYDLGALADVVPVSRLDESGFLSTTACSEEAPPQSLSQYARISTELSRSETITLLQRNPPETHFGSIKLLQSWLPTIDPNDQKSLTLVSYLSRRHLALGLQLGLTIVFLAINISTTVWATIRYDIKGDTGTVFQGSCTKANRLNSGFHLVINILSTAVLGASNFSMQILASPTRGEVDRAHSRKKWFNIGTPSLKNLGMISRMRVIVYAVLALSSATLHLFWNSAIFESFPFISYTTVFVTDDYLTNNNPWGDVGDDHTRAPQTNGREFDRLNGTSCIQRYMDPLSGAGDIVVLTNLLDNSLTNNDSTSFVKSFRIWDTSNWDRLQTWIYDSPDYPHRPYSERKLLPYAGNWTVNVEGQAIPVEYCLGQPVQDLSNRCGLHFNTTIMIIVCVMNFVKVLGVAYTWIQSLRAHRRERRAYDSTAQEALVTIGDCMQSFLNRSDDHTRQMCLVSQFDFERGSWHSNLASRPWPGPLLIRKFTLASRRVWITTISACTAIVVIVLALLGRGIVQQKNEGVEMSLSTFWEPGLGRANPMTAIQIFIYRGPSQFWGAVILANSWQLEISLLYLLYNTLLTRLCVAVEWSHYGLERKFLRVSCPKGMQRSTYFLSLPFRYSVPLSACLLLLHWLVSQSVFLARSTAFLPSGEPIDSDSSSRACYSTMGIILSLATGIVLIVTLIGIGFQRTMFLLPPVSTCSAAISAACHQPEGDSDAALLPVEWAVVVPSDAESQPPVVGHCSLTTLANAEGPQLGKYFQSRDLVIAEAVASSYGIPASNLMNVNNVRSFNQTVFGSIGYETGAALGAFAAGKADGSIKHLILVTSEGSLQLTIKAFSDFLHHGLNTAMHWSRFLLSNDGYTVERLIHGMEASYNQVARWNYSKVWVTFGPSFLAKYCRVQTGDQLLELFTDVQLVKADCTQVAKLILHKHGAPMSVKLATKAVEEFNKIKE
ncbi:uncharacterized protein N7496_012323 [Penicillium cataractarum]|uniref:DUF6536 domain-containing protein n=1 Tax=Penicillium cataractarum TaxID=2100454 RepID=A0A9W9R7N6_9EURO|nr:uncharacterized protein N7496_012323 [Penicillium cataractarum]KAJ5355111.1 hypothetical protein N7496_012323 [Penicillium cataractarum]